MSLILNIETATTVCSVSLSESGRVISYQELDAGYTHAENLHLFIQKLLADAGADARELRAVALSKGPGSYTGLRIGSSAAKGLCFSLNIPLIAIDTLQIMAADAVKRVQEDAIYCPMIDARRMEVYVSAYNQSLQQLNDVEALIVDEGSILKFSEKGKTFFFGDGMSKCKALLSKNSNAFFIDAVAPSSRFMAGLADKKFQASDFENVAYFEPFYLKNFIAGKPKQAPKSI